MKIKQIIKQQFIGKKVKFTNIPKGDQDWINNLELKIEGLDIEIAYKNGIPYEAHRSDFELRIDFYCRRLSDNETINVYNIGLDFELEFI